MQKRVGGSTQGMRKDVPVIQTVEGLLLSLMVDDLGLAAASEVLNYWKECVWPVLLSFP